MERRPPGYAGELPWWAYGEKPDLRWVRHRRPAGQWDARIELEPHPDTFLSFPSWAWDEIFWCEHLTFTQQEQNHWTRAMREAVPDEDLWPLPEP